jgi:hypothetical protein
MTEINFNAVNFKTGANPNSTTLLGKTEIARKIFEISENGGGILDVQQMISLNFEAIQELRDLKDNATTKQTIKDAIEWFLSQSSYEVYSKNSKNSKIIPESNPLKDLKKLLIIPKSVKELPLTPLTTLEICLIETILKDSTAVSQPGLINKVLKILGKK